MNVNIKRFLATSAVALALPLAGNAVAGCGGFDGPGDGFFDGPKKHQKHRFAGLNLTDKQNDQIFAIRHNAEPQLRDKMKTLRELKKQMFELRKADNYSLDAAKDLQRKISATRGELDLLQLETDYALFNVLTPEQKAQTRQAPPPFAKDKKGKKGERRGPGQQGWGQQWQGGQAGPGGNPFMPPWMQDLPDAPMPIPGQAPVAPDGKATPPTPAPAPAPTAAKAE